MVKISIRTMYGWIVAGTARVSIAAASSFRRSSGSSSSSSRRQAAISAPGMAQKQPFLLASAPVSSLRQATWMCKEAGGRYTASHEVEHVHKHAGVCADLPLSICRYTAGDAEDQLNARVIGKDEQWRTAWKGKTHQVTVPDCSSGQQLTCHSGHQLLSLLRQELVSPNF